MKILIHLKSTTPETVEFINIKCSSRLGTNVQLVRHRPSDSLDTHSYEREYLKNFLMKQKCFRLQLSYH